MSLNGQRSLNSQPQINSQLSFAPKTPSSYKGAAVLLNPKLRTARCAATLNGGTLKPHTFLSFVVQTLF